MKSFMTGVIASGLVAAASAANAQALPAYRIGAPTVLVSDIGGPYAAMPAYPARGYVAAALLPPSEVYAVLRDAGYSPLGPLRQRGPFYTITAISLDGDDGSLVIDARGGRIVRFMPAVHMDESALDEVAVAYGPQALLPPIRNFGHPPRPPASVPHLANRSPNAVPLPKDAPPHAVVEPKIESKPQAAQPAPAPVQQSAVAQPKPADAAPVAAPAPVQAKPPVTLQPTQPMPAAQGLD